MTINALSAWTYDTRPPCLGGRAHGSSVSWSSDPAGRLESQAHAFVGGTTAYGYDAENRLVTASNGGSLVYDPLGRLFQTSGGTAGIIRFLYDGDDLVSEFDSAGAIVRRYVHGPGIDDPLLWYEGPSDGDRRSLLADHQGSIVAVANSAGAMVAINGYDEWGIPSPGNQGRFQYTGQAWIPELGMYYYKARVYSATLGRFLQTDPIGYDDQMNLYAYVGNDPVNYVDNEGLQRSRVLPFPGTLPIPGTPTAGDRDGNGFRDQDEEGARRLQKTWDRATETFDRFKNWLFSDDVTVVEGSPPSRGEPNSTVQGRGTTRKYDKDGLPVVDVDSPNPGARPGTVDAVDHAHDWTRPADGGYPRRGEHRRPQEGDPPPPHRGDPRRKVDQH